MIKSWKWVIMVDPNRKINRLSDDDAAFLVECEQDFRCRYTDADQEFFAFCSKPTRPPPIVEPWQNRRQHDGGNGNWNRNNYRSGNGNFNRNHHFNRNNDNRRQHHYRQHYDRPYDRNFTNFRREGESSSQSHHNRQN